jgi:N-methylhydantoinase B
VDFTGSAPQAAGSINAVRAITVSAVFYVFRCLVPGETPATAGLLRPIEVLTRPRTVVDSEPPAAVAAGNVETSQRIVDIVLGALAQAVPERIPAASQGTMNNLTLGGSNPDKSGRPFAYYETIAGGMGARPTKNGIDGIHVHMTNTMNTPIEALEFAYPMRIERYELRDGTGGKGKHRGGTGVRRDVRVLCDAQGAILSERRKIAPYGLQGGESGGKGENVLIRDGWERYGVRSLRGHGRELTLCRSLPGKTSLDLKAGDVVSLRTPGGGGWGKR